MSDSPRDLNEYPTGGSWFIRVGIIGFLLTCVFFFFFGSGFSPTTSAPGYPLMPTAQPQLDGSFIATFDVADREEWVGFSFGGGKVVPDRSGANLMVRRHAISAPGGAISLGDVPLVDAEVSADIEWEDDEMIDGALQSPPMLRWYNYSYWTHMLTPKDETFAARISSDRAAVFQIVSYYCEPEGSGCFTLRYRLVSLAAAKTG